MPDSLYDVYKKHSDRKFVGIYDLGGKPSFLINDPELINRISIKDFDSFVNHFLLFDKELNPLIVRTLFAMSNQEWREMRGTLSPLFTGSKMRQMLSIMVDCSNEFNAYVRNDITSKSGTDNSLEFDMSELMMRLTNDIIGSTAFGIQMNSLKEVTNDFFKMGKEMAYAMQGVRAVVNIGFPKIAKFFNLKVITDSQDQFFRGTIRSAVAERRKMKIERNDMLNLLLLAQEGKLSDEKDKESDQDTGFATVSEFIAARKAEKLKNWTEDDLVAQSILFFLAGFTGISMSLCFACHELAVNLDIQKRLHEEIVEVNDELHGKSVTFEALQKMKYLDMVVSEVLRKWPLAVIMDRNTNKQYVMEDHDGTKALLQPNDIVWFPIYGIHRDPKYYPNPEVFDPERFSDENKPNIRPGTFIPFGMGPRACIGSRFALLQIKAILYNLLLNFHIDCSARTQIPLKLKGNGMAVSVEVGFFNQLRLRN
ncbi:hypothetical protein HA402_001859 [Bradysia odoriphaga]|nr:hypothetical protein HA402_001859 [Bradysia odoriphaga]